MVDVDRFRSKRNEFVVWKPSKCAIGIWKRKKWNNHNNVRVQEKCWLMNKKKKANEIRSIYIYIEAWRKERESRAVLSPMYEPLKRRRENDNLIELQLLSIRKKERNRFSLLIVQEKRQREEKHHHLCSSVQIKCRRMVSSNGSIVYFHRRMSENWLIDRSCHEHLTLIFLFSRLCSIDEWLTDKYWRALRAQHWNRKTSVQYFDSTWLSMKWRLEDSGKRRS